MPVPSGCRGTARSCSIGQACLQKVPEGLDQVQRRQHFFGYPRQGLHQLFEGLDLVQDRGSSGIPWHPRSKLREKHIDSFRQLDVGAEGLLKLAHKLVPLSILARQHILRSLHMCSHVCEEDIMPEA